MHKTLPLLFSLRVNIWILIHVQKLKKKTRETAGALIIDILTHFSLHAGLMKFLGKGTTGKIIEETDEKMDRLLKTFKAQFIYY